MKKLVVYNVKPCFYLVEMAFGQHSCIHLYFCCPILFEPSLQLLCILHNILFISVDELNDTIAANLSDTDFYGGELW